MLARRVLLLVAQLRFEHAAIVATLSANISLAGMYSEIGDIDHGYVLSFLLQMLFDSKRELCSLWDIPGMLLVPSARSEQQDVILCFEIPDESSAFCRDEAYVFLIRADHEIHAFLQKPSIFLRGAFRIYGSSTTLLAGLVCWLGETRYRLGPAGGRSTGRIYTRCECCR